MAKFDLGSLLAGDEFSDLQGVVKQAMAKHREEAQARLGTLLVGILASTDTIVRQNVQKLRTIRKQEQVQRELLEQIGKTVEHLNKTGNPLPFYKVTGNTLAANRFCNELGVPVPEADDKLWNV